jgi:hypothetical protein
VRHPDHPDCGECGGVREDCGESRIVNIYCHPWHGFLLWLPWPSLAPHYPAYVSGVNSIFLAKLNQSLTHGSSGDNLAHLTRC